jgi:hypothetical protein
VAPRLRPSRSLALLIFLVLAIVHTWPLVTAPGRLSRNDHPDTLLNEWTIAWVAHEAPRAPWHLFDANIFYPDRGALAYSENLIVPAAMGAPLFWAGVSPVLVYNLLLLAGFTLTGWAGAMLVWRWTGDWPAGLIAGVILAFNAHSFTRLPHLQAQHVEFLPLVWLAFDDVLRQPQVRTALKLAAWFTLQSLVSVYLMVFTVVALVVGGLVRPEDWWGARAKRVAPALIVAAVVSVVVLLPFLLPYKHLNIVRPLDEVALYTARWRNYLATPARLHYSTWSARFFGGTALFPGSIGLALAVVAIADGVAFTDRRARMLLASGLAGVALSFGPTLPGYAMLYRWLPLLQAVRAVARFGYLAIAATAVLAGFGAAALRARWRDARWLPAATAALFVLANADGLCAPIAYTDAQPVLSVYNRLRRAANAVVVEFPFYPPDRTFHNAPYVFNSIRYWHPLVNGYSGLVPTSYEVHYAHLHGFPDGESMASLHQLGVTHVVVHDKALRAWSSAYAADAVGRTRDLVPIETDGDVTLYRLRQ